MTKLSYEEMERRLMEVDEYSAAADRFALWVFALFLTTLAVAGTWLVMTEHYGWAWIPWVVLFLMMKGAVDVF